MRTRLLRKNFSSHPLLPPIFIVIGLFILGVVGLLFFSSPSEDLIPFTTECLPILRDTRIPSTAFAWLPALPDCFSIVRSSYYNGTIPSTKILSSEYYLQPEFYPNFESSGIASWTTPSSTHYGALGVSSFRSNAIPIVLSRSNIVNFRFFVHSSFGVRAYQGVRLSASVSDANYSNFVSVSIDDSSSEGFVLGPSYFTIHPKWVHPVDVTVSVSPDAPSGHIPITVELIPLFDNFASPTWVPSEALFFDATSYLGPRPIFSAVATLP